MGWYLRVLWVMIRVNLQTSSRNSNIRGECNRCISYEIYLISYATFSPNWYYFIDEFGYKVLSLRVRWVAPAWHVFSLFPRSEYQDLNSTGLRPVSSMAGGSGVTCSLPPISQVLTTKAAANSVEPTLLGHHHITFGEQATIAQQLSGVRHLKGAGPLA